MRTSHYIRGTIIGTTAVLSLSFGCKFSKKSNNPNVFVSATIPRLDFAAHPIEPQLLTKAKMVPAQYSLQALAASYKDSDMFIVTMNIDSSSKARNIIETLEKQTTQKAILPQASFLFFRKDNAKASFALEGDSLPAVTAATLPSDERPVMVEFEGRAYDLIYPREDTKKALIIANVDQFNVDAADGSLKVKSSGRMSTLSEEQVFPQNRKSNWKFVMAQGDDGQIHMRAADKEAIGKEGKQSLHHPSLAGYDSANGRFNPVLTAGVIEKGPTGDIYLKVDSGNYGLDTLDDFRKSQHQGFIANFLQTKGVAYEVQPDGLIKILARSL